MITTEQACEDLKRAVETWDEQLMRETIREAMDSDVSPEELINNGLSLGMETISDLFDRGLLFLPQVLYASRVMDEAMKILVPENASVSGRYRGTVVMGTVSGDVHEIGKNVCCAMLRGAGYNVVDIGSDVSPEDFIDAVESNSADILGGSSLMTTTLDAQRRTVEAIREKGSKVITMFGGAPCSQKWVDSIKGDCYSASGPEMVRKANSKMTEKTKVRTP